MRILLSLLAATLALASSASATASSHKHAKTLTLPSEVEFESMFTSFIKTYNKQYTHDDFFNRFSIFKQNIEKIMTHNHANTHKYSLAMNEFTDLSFSEFKASKFGYKHIDQSYLRSKNFYHNKKQPIAASVDWRQHNAVTPVTNQGQCGSSPYYAAVAAVEGAWALKTGKLVELSVQEIIDCSSAQGNQGCNGGTMDGTFQWIISNNGIASAADYPYTGVQGTCHSSTVKNTASITSFKDVAAADEKSLLAAVNLGPVAVALEADQEAFQFYSKGVLTGTCGTNIDHGMTVVGYGTDTGVDYWIVKNQWGTSWGEAGYIRIERGINECGVASSASYPIV